MIRTLLSKKFTSILTFLFFGLFAGNALLAQTPGQIITPATGEGRLILDPNGDGFVSASSTGFSPTNTDYGTASELNYYSMPLLFTEAKSDPRTGGAHTDLFGIEGKDPGGFMFNDATNILYRVRLISQSQASKGYSFLIDTNGDATPNYEIIMRTGGGQKGVAIYEKVGDTVTRTNFVSDLDNRFHRALAGIHATGSGSEQTFYYDWFVPISSMPAGLQNPTGGTFRAVVVTVTSATGGYLTGGTLADIGGLSDGDFANDAAAVKAILSLMPDAGWNDLKEGGTGFANPKSAIPSILAPIVSTDTSVSGTSIENEGTQITLRVYNADGNLVSTHTNITTVNASNSWTATGLTLTAGQTIEALATATGKSVSDPSTRVPVRASGESAVCTPAPIDFDRSGNNFVGFVPSLPIPTAQANLTIRLYASNSGALGNLLHSTNSADGVNTVAYTTFTQDSEGKVRWIIDRGGAGGNPYNNEFFVTAQRAGECESDFAFDGAAVQTAAPVITTNKIPEAAGTQTISGTSTEANGTTITLLQE